MQGFLSMIFPKPPQVSKIETSKAGELLIDRNAGAIEIADAFFLMDQWRACHAYPINTFQATLRTKVRNGKFGKGAFIAQRLKRSSTILEKLKQFPSLRLATMQDIAGVRAVLPSIEDVRKLVIEYKQTTRFEHKLIREKDYISKPKDDGYRSFHLIYRYKNKAHKDWDNLLIELQIRTALQHSWATAVEAILLLLGKGVKARKGQWFDKEWTEFLALVSSAFAYIEGTPPTTAHIDMSKKDILDRILAYEEELKVIDKLLALPVAFNMLPSRCHYCLIILNYIEKIVRVKSFKREEFSEANKEYARVEKRYRNKERVEPVLVSTTGGYLKQAYAGFFGDTDDFRKNLEYVLSGEWV